MVFPAYARGYREGGDNPFLFPQALSDKRMAIACLPKLTEAQKTQLRELNDAFEATEWAQFSRGRYARKNPAKRK